MATKDVLGAATYLHSCTTARQGEETQICASFATFNSVSKRMFDYLFEGVQEPATAAAPITMEELIDVLADPLGSESPTSNPAEFAYKILNRKTSATLSPDPEVSGCFLTLKN